jgi:hypothetical protein
VREHTNPADIGYLLLTVDPDAGRINEGNSMSALSLRLPESIHRHIREIAKKEGVSINQFISSAVSEKISVLMTEDYLKNRAKRAKKEDFRKILAKVPSRKPLPGDEL